MKIDQAIVDIINRLNELGFKTLASCAGYDYKGHQNPKTSFYPFVVFKTSIKKARQLARCFSDAEDTRWRIEVHSQNNCYRLEYAFPTDNQDSYLAWNQVRTALKVKK